MEFIFVVIYFVGMVVTYGVNLAYWQREYPTIAESQYGRDVKNSRISAIIWPFTLLPFAFICGFHHGIKFKNS